MSEEILVKRDEKVAFYGIKEENGIKNYRMRGFTDAGISKSAKEYTRQYVDEASERTDIVGYSTSMSYAFDQFLNNKVHEDISNIHDKEIRGTEAVKSIIIVDFTKSIQNKQNTYEAKMRNYTVVPDTEGDSMDAYTYSGNLKANGENVFGEATSTDDWETCTFTKATEAQVPVG